MGPLKQLLSIKASPRFPRSPDKQIDFPVHSIGALLAGYEPSTGRRYLAGLGGMRTNAVSTHRYEQIRDGKSYSLDAALVECVLQFFQCALPIMEDIERYGYNNSGATVLGSLG